MTNETLVEAAATLARRSSAVEAELLPCLGEIDARQLYLERAYDSMFAFCVGELGFSEDAAFNRISVARRARQFPAMIDALRSGQVHLTGLRLLAPHVSEANHRELLAQAARKTKREIEELLAKRFPQPPAPAVIRKLPQGRLPLSADGPHESAQVGSAPTEAPHAPQRSQRPTVAPLAEDAFKIQFTAPRAVRDKLREAQDLMRHRVPDGDVATIVGAALDLLVARMKKERFGIGSKPRKARPHSGVAVVPRADQTRANELRANEAHATRAHATQAPPNDAPATGAPANDMPAAGTPSTDTPMDGALALATSRYVPVETRRAVFLRDGGRCTFVDERGRRCCATSGLEIDHIDGFARTHSHDVGRLRLLCAAHNWHAAVQLYGRAFMERARRSKGGRTRPGTGRQTHLF